MQKLSDDAGQFEMLAVSEEKGVPVCRFRSLLWSTTEH